MYSRLLLVFGLMACSSNTSNPVPGADVPPSTDTVPGDGGADVLGVDSPTDTPIVPSDAPQMNRCGTERPSLPTTATEGLVIGPDGTIYFSRSGGVRQIRPGMAVENLISLQDASTVWGLALDTTTNKLYVGIPSAAGNTGRIDEVDLAQTPPTSRTLLMRAGAANGLTIGPDNALWYTDFGSGHVFRVTSDGTSTQVTSTPIPQADGIAFGTDGKLYVTQYAPAGGVFRIELTANMETSRLNLVRSGAAGADGLAFDAMGRFYVTAGGRLTRYEADGSGAMMLLSGLSSAANIEFGVGALPCTDIYVATGRGLVRYEMGDTPGAAVPWHR